MNATLFVVAKKAGVSVATASRALRGLANVSPKTRKAVRAVADALGYQPNALFSALGTHPRRGGRHKLIPVACLSRIDWPNVVSNDAMQQRGRELGLLFTLFPTPPDGDPAAAEAAVRSRECCGVLIDGPQLARHLSGISWEGMAVIAAMDLQPDLAGYHQICGADPGIAAKSCLDALLQRGHRRISFVYEPENPSHWEDEVRLHLLSGLAVAHGAVLLPCCERETPAAIRQLRRDRATAIIGLHAGAYYDLLSHGCRLPYVALITSADDRSPFSGYQVDDRIHGIACAELMSELLRYRRVGRPEQPILRFISGRWHGGSTIEG